MVCLSSICCLPLAEGILSPLGKNSNNIIIDYAGASAFHIGEFPDTRSIEIAKVSGIDITNQRSRKFIVDDFNFFDIIHAINNSNHKTLLSLASTDLDRSKVKLILNEIYPQQNLEVPDPYYGEGDSFKKVYDML